MTREHFTRLVEEALRDIPRRFRAEMKNVAVVVEDEPPPHSSRRWRSSPATRCSASTRALPCPSAAGATAIRCPIASRSISSPIVDACEDEDEIRDCVAETVIHEFGHYFGMSEEEIEEIEEKYWRGESIDDV